MVATDQDNLAMQLLEVVAQVSEVAITEVNIVVDKVIFAYNCISLLNELFLLFLGEDLQETREMPWPKVVVACGKRVA